jgi:transposase-like protein
MLNITNYFCTNPECKDYGIKGKGNLNVHFTYGKYNRRMLYCTTCKARFSETKCTAFFGSKYSAETIGKIISTTAEGVGVRATARIHHLDKDAVNRVILRAGEHCRRVLDNLLVQLGLTEIQLDELWAFIEKKTLPGMMKGKETEKRGYGQGLIQRRD